MRRLVLGLAFLASLGVAGSAVALCTCGDRDGCSSAAACSGKIPGDECSNGRSCKIVVGTGNDLTCCCGCSKGVGPVSCNYAPLVGSVALPVACGSEPLGELARKTETGMNADLGKAFTACRDERNALKKANAARGKLARLRKKVEKAAQKGTIDGVCAAQSLALLDLVSSLVDDIEAGNGPSFPGNTTTTIPAGPSCSATFTTFPGDAAEVDFTLGCFAAGTDYQGFELTMNGGRQVTNFLAPSGFNCSIRTETGSNDSLACAGLFNIDVPVTGGRIRTDPSPVSDMDAALRVLVGTEIYGPFPTTGP
jgi:hypothetical protein